MFNSLNQPLYQVTLSEISKHEFPGFLPKTFPYFCVYTAIANDGELVVIGRNVNEHAAPQCRIIHSESVEIYRGPIHSLSFASRLNVQAYFAGRITLRHLNGVYDFLLLLFGEWLHIRIVLRVPDQRLPQQRNSLFA